jgi:hypothetical protein
MTKIGANVFGYQKWFSQLRTEIPERRRVIETAGVQRYVEDFDNPRRYELQDAVSGWLQVSVHKGWVLVQAKAAARLKPQA